MADREATQSRTSSNSKELKRYDSQALRAIGAQVEALLSWHSSLEMYRRSIERQVTLLASRLHMEDRAHLPREVFLQVEMRGSGGLRGPLEQIARILAEVGYWKPSGYGQSYHPHDVYYLGRSAQRLFDDCAALHGRVSQLHTHLSYITLHLSWRSDMTPQEIFEGMAMATPTDRAEVQASVDAIIDLLERQTVGWRLFAAIRRLNPLVGRGRGFRRRLRS